MDFVMINIGIRKYEKDKLQDNLLNWITYINASIPKKPTQIKQVINLKFKNI